MNSFRFREAGLTHPGKVRAINEDAYVTRPGGLWVVADGMGGHENGQWASATIVERLEHAALTDDFDQSVGTVAQAIHAANAAIKAEADAHGRSMGSTVAALLICGTRFAVFWAGDSRVYLLRGGALVQLSQDHSQVQAMVDAGYLTPEEARTHPMRNVIARAVGVEAQLELDALADEAEVGDVFMLCSDGLHGMVTDEEIATALRLQAPPGAVETLLNSALERGAPDNVTVVVLACEEATAMMLA